MEFSIPKLSDKQIQKIADILADLGVVLAVSTILPSILNEFKPSKFVLGVIISLIFWLTSIGILNTKTWNQ